MKILIAGNFSSPIHEQAFLDAFLSLGVDASKFSYSDYFLGYQNKKPKGIIDTIKSLYYKTQNKFIFGPIIWEINKDLISAADKNQPDLIFIYRGTCIYSETIKTLKKKGSIVFGYNNDDPFGEDHPSYLWRLFLQAIPFYDHIFVYRRKNIEDYKKMGFDKTSMLRSYYLKDKNYHMGAIPSPEYKCDVVFVGHFEGDGRDEYIKKIIDSGINFRLYGPEWHRSKYYDYIKSKAGDGGFLNGKKYNLALNSSKIALVFLSKLNNDTYTRRCFEIPAAGTFMLAQYSEDLASMFIPGIEADYFNNIEESIDKIKYYLAHDEERKRIAANGRSRLLADGHEVVDRAREIIRVFNEYKK